MGKFLDEELPYEGLNDDDDESLETTEEIEVEDEEDEIEIVVVDDKEVEEEEEEEEEVLEEEPKEEQPHKGGGRAQQRIRELVRQRNDAETKMRELEQRLNQIEQEKENFRGRALNSEISAVRNAEASLGADKKILQAEWIAAQDTGDTDKQFEVNQKIIELKMREAAVKRKKIELNVDDNWKPNQKKEEELQEHPRKKPEELNDGEVEETVRKIKVNDPTVGRWIEKHKGWFFKNTAMREVALAVNNKLIMEDGLDPKREDFYIELDRQLMNVYPDKFALKKKGAKGPVGKGGNGSMKKKNVVKLTKLELDAAKRMGVDPKRWAAEKEKMKREGVA